MAGAAPLDAAAVRPLLLLLTARALQFKEALVPQKLECLPLLTSVVMLCQDAPHVAQSTDEWDQNVWFGLRDLLQNKLGAKDRGACLVLASATFQLLGPDWLFPAVDSEKMQDHYKFAALLIHLTCTELRVILDKIDVSSVNDPKKDPKCVGNNHETDALVISHLSLLTNAIKTLVQMFTPDNHQSQDSNSNSPQFPPELLISLHHALAESFIAVLAHLIDRFEVHKDSTKQQTNLGSCSQSAHVFVHSNPTVLACIRAIGIWLTEDDQALTISEVASAMELLVFVSRCEEVGWNELGGVFANVTALDSEENKDVMPPRPPTIQESGDDVDGEGVALNCKTQFLMFGGAELLKDWMLGENEHERRVAVCCLLNLVVSSGGGVQGFQKGFGNGSQDTARDFAKLVALKCLDTDLMLHSGSEKYESVVSVASVHIMNACCLTLFVVRDMGEDSMILKKVVSTCMTWLYKMRLLEGSDNDEWLDISELWFLSINALTALVKRYEEIRVLLVALDDFAQLAQYCGQFAQKEGADLSFDEDSSLLLFKAVGF
ncbi:Neurochondrin-domain-containing protein [Obelidium mucronatum]|nr:Neurochondrin-domain-containing protein [Obelidium mucronatum]